ncbi:hypothetical protein ACLK17_12575 [Escherichia coli]
MTRHFPGSPPAKTCGDIVLATLIPLLISPVPAVLRGGETQFARAGYSRQTRYGMDGKPIKVLSSVP